MSVITKTAALHVLQDPQTGHVLTVSPGTRLAVRFRRRGLGLSRWHVVDRPGHLVPLEEGDHVFMFLVFGGEGSDERPLRLVRRRVDRPGSDEFRDLTVLVG